MGWNKALLMILVSGMIFSSTSSAGWSSFRGDHANTGHSEGSDLSSGVGFGLVWEFRADAPVSGSVVGTQETVFFNTRNGSIYALSRQSGELIYKRQVGGNLLNSPALDVQSGHLVAATSNGEVISFTMEEGRKVWNSTPGSRDEIHSSPNIHEGLLVVASYDSDVHCIDMITGERIWTFGGCGERIHTTPSFHDGQERDMVYFGACDGVLYAVDRMDGSPVWNFSAEYIPSSPAIHDGEIIFGSFDGNLYCLDAETGSKVWSSNLEGPIFSSPALDENHVSVANDEGTLFLISRIDGSVIWNRTLGDSLSTSPVLSDDHVIVTGPFGMKILSVDNGTEEGGFELGDASDTSPSVIGDMILFGDSEGYVRAVMMEESGTTDPLDLGEEDDPGKDVVFLIIGSLFVLIVGLLLYLGYIRMRREQQ